MPVHAVGRMKVSSQSRSMASRSETTSLMGFHGARVIQGLLYSSTPFRRWRFRGLRPGPSSATDKTLASLARSASARSSSFAISSSKSAASRVCSGCFTPDLWAGTPSRGGPRLAAVRIAASSLMAMRFGLDFGTSNTSLAVNDGSSTRVLPIDRLVGETMPTVLYIRRDGSALVGREAIDAYLEDNRTRGPLKREIKMLGIRLPSTDWTHKSLEAYILTDTSAPGRRFQALKTFLGDPLQTQTNVLGDAKE